jgi:hypothetical protein
VFTADVNLAKAKRYLVRAVRFFPVIALLTLATAYYRDALSQEAELDVIDRSLLISLYLLIGVIPLLLVLGFGVIGYLADREFKRSGFLKDRLAVKDPFELPTEEMRGYKLALITDRPPLFTGLTGDSYKADDQAICTLNSEHIPPVADCECGFYAYKDLVDTKFELSINPGTFLIEVDLFGLGFIYKRGFRAESQVVRRIHIPRRCMRCHFFPARNFVALYRLGYGANAWWQWQVRCTLCAKGVKPENQMSILEMKLALGLSESPASAQDRPSR